MKKRELAFLILALVACSNQRDAASEAAPQLAKHEVRVRNLPPTRKDLIGVVIASSQLSLRVSPTCSNVGTESADSTIGQYLSGFIAEQAGPIEKNWIETSVDSIGAADSVVTASVTIRHASGNDEWGWGVRFAIRLRDSLVIENSFVCTGAG